MDELHKLQESMGDCEEMLERFFCDPGRSEVPDIVDNRALALARTNLQQACMWLDRALGHDRWGN